MTTYTLIGRPGRCPGYPRAPTPAPTGADGPPICPGGCPALDRPEAWQWAPVGFPGCPGEASRAGPQHHYRGYPAAGGARSHSADQTAGESGLGRFRGIARRRQCLSAGGAGHRDRLPVSERTAFYFNLCGRGPSAGEGGRIRGFGEGPSSSPGSDKPHQKCLGPSQMRRSCCAAYHRIVLLRASAPALTIVARCLIWFDCVQVAVVHHGCHS